MNSGKRQCKAIAALLVLASVLCVCTEAGGGWIITTPGGNLLDEYASFIAGGTTPGGVPEGAECFVEIYKYNITTPHQGVFLQSRAGESNGFGDWATTPSEPFAPPPWPDVNSDPHSDLLFKLLVGETTQQSKEYKVVLDGD